MSKVVEKRVAEIIVITVITVVLLGMSSCGNSGHCIQNEWATPLSKQYSKR